MAASSWQATAQLTFTQGMDPDGRTHFQGGATAPLKVLRAVHHSDGRCELPLLHTAGGLVGGDRLRVVASLASASRALITSVAAQKVYGSVGRSRLQPQGLWAEQQVRLHLAAGSNLEWLPQELVLFADGLYRQRLRVDLEPGASFLGAEVVRLGRTAAGEGLGRGRWRSCLEMRQRPPAPHSPLGWRHALVDRLELDAAALAHDHGLGGQPVLGSLVWAAPGPLPADSLAQLLAEARQDRRGLEGSMACGPLEQGLIARYRGPSCQAARWWFTRLWARIRQLQGLPPPVLPRVWPFQEDPWAGSGPVAEPALCGR